MADAIKIGKVKFEKETKNWIRLNKIDGNMLPEAIYVPHGVAKEGDEFILALIPVEKKG